MIDERGGAHLHFPIKDAAFIRERRLFQRQVKDLGEYWRIKETRTRYAQFTI